MPCYSRSHYKTYFQMRGSIPTQTLAATFVLLAANNLQLCADFQISDSTTANVNLSSSLTYYSNLFLVDAGRSETSEKESDNIVSISPSFNIKKGDDSSLVSMTGTVGVNYYEFLDNSEFSRTDPFLTLFGRYNGDRLKSDALFSTKDIVLPSHGNRNANGYSISNLRVNGNYEISPRTSLATDLSTSETNYENQSRNDYNNYTLPIRVLYHISEDLKAGIGYRFRKTEFEGGSDRNDTIWHLSLEGKLTQDVELDIRLGHNQSDFIDATLQDLENIYVSSDATWQISEDSKLIAHFSNKAGAYSNGQSVERTWLRTNYQWAITETLQSSAGIAFLTEDFSNTIRKDKLQRLEAALIYAPDAVRYSGQLSISYEDNNSNVFGLDYTNTIISANFNYTF